MREIEDHVVHYTSIDYTGYKKEHSCNSLVAGNEMRAEDVRSIVMLWLACT